MDTKNLSSNHSVPKRSKWDDGEDESTLLPPPKRHEGNKTATSANSTSRVAPSTSPPTDTLARSKPPTSSVSPSSSPIPSSQRTNIQPPSREASVASVGPTRPPIQSVPLRSSYPPIAGCPSISSYQRLNHIEEGSYGVVFRAKHIPTGDIVAVKKLKMDREKNGFPITSLREIRTLMDARHPNVVEVREIVVGETLTQIFIVMEFVEHDLKTLLHNMRTPFLSSEIKTLLLQLLSAMSLLHSNWIIHRDLKTSNLLMNNRGQLKLADFGLARLYGDPPRKEGEGAMTDLVVTLWYRAPELLLGAKDYDTAIDMWSVGCIFAELILNEPLFTGKNETDQIARIFRLLGTPSEDVWPGVSKLPNARQAISSTSRPYSSLRQKFRHSTQACLDLLSRLLIYDPTQRITADEALAHPFFKESPAPAHPDSFGSFPSVAAGEKRHDPSPSAPTRLADQKLAYQLELDL